MLARHARLRHTGARLLVLALVTILVTPLLALGGSSQDAAAASELPVYTDALESGWSNWSWSTATNFANSGPVYSGSAAAAVTYSAAWGGFYLHSGSLIAGSNYATFRFSIHGGNQGGQRLLVKLADANGNFGAGVAVTAPAGAWTQVSVPLASLGNIQQISGIIWQDATGGTQPTFYLDSISFVSTGEPSTQTTPSAAGPALSVNAGANRHAISPDIYGMNYLDEALAAELRLPVRRWGGNAATRYNWQNDTANRERLVFPEHAGRQQQSGGVAGRFNCRWLRGAESTDRYPLDAHRPLDRIYAQGSYGRLWVQRGQIRRPAADGPIPSRLWQWPAG